MIKTKLFAVFTRNIRMGMLTSRNLQSDTTGNVADKKLEYYRNLNALEDVDLTPVDWKEAKPFKSIPGPKPLPLIGNSWRFILPKIGDFYGMDIINVHKEINQKYGDVSILKGLMGLEPLLLLFNAEDVEKLHRNEGIWPKKKEYRSFDEYRKLKRNVGSETGLTALQGEEWFKYRTVVNAVLMQPKSILQHTGKLNLVTDEFIDNMKYLSKKNEQGQMPDDFQQEIYKWALESVGMVTLNTPLGCLKRNNKNSEAVRILECVPRMFELMFKLDMMPGLWKYVSTPNWREFVRVLDFILDTNSKHINKQLERIKKGDNHSGVSSVLDEIIKVDPSVAVTMAANLMAGGVDTTGRIVAAALYYLAKNPEIQKNLREEAYSLLESKDSPVTQEIITKAFYAKAVIKETNRISPISLGNMRTTSKNLIFGGYQVPAGTHVLTSTLLLCKQEQHFPRAKEFLPERWLRTTTGELSFKNTNPFVYAPFGYGPRTCIGKRMAILEMEVAVLKIIRNFELKWPHEDIEFSTSMLHGITGPLRIQIKALSN